MNASRPSCLVRHVPPGPARATAARLPHPPGQARPGRRLLPLLMAAVVLTAGWATWNTAHAQAAPGASVTERREAGAAAAEARRGNLKDQGQDYRANALQRCAPLPADLRGDCESRVRGEGQVSGSVQGGGILRETVTTTIVPAPAPAPDPAPAPAEPLPAPATPPTVPGGSPGLLPPPPPPSAPEAPQPPAR
ncbi:MAG: hypothetical protein GAK30_02656 [Paracidovorax wautersii]|uniref:Uncharacterized protein n=1 Tax=Paracidovorax wautersii TaxID=1177982 RepID=A0A7V8JPV4_9BURK|nr:MAG: hypothetical protein GAK30_02656 [Paracidovorax wautersii]